MLNNLKNIKIDLIVLLVIFLFFALIAIFFPQFPCYDFLNYHWYNTIAFLDGRHEIDLFAANIRSYFNPLIDLPATLLILKFNNHPLFLNILFTLDETVLMFFLYKIIDYLLQDRKKVVILCVSFFSIFYAFSSPIIFQQSAFGQNDIVFSVYVLAGYYFFLKYIFNSNTYLLQKSFFLGLILGFSFGLKLVAISYVILFTLFFIFFRKHFEKPYKMLLLFVIGSVTAFFLTHGYWCYFCYQKFGNPFFPYFNHIFHSPFADDVNLRTIDFTYSRAKTVFQYLFYCFFPDGETYFGTDNGAWDLRIAINYLLLLFISIYLFISYFCKKSYSLLNIDKNLFSVFLFVLIPFVINTHLFGLYRYIIPSLLFFGYILFFCISSLVSKYKLKNIITCVLVFFTFSFVLVFSKYGRLEFLSNSFSEKYKDTLFLDLKSPQFEKDFYVLLLNQPASFLIDKNTSKNPVYSYYLPVQYLKKIAQIVPSYENRHLHSSYMKKKTEELILGNKKLYVVYHFLLYPIYIESLDYYNLKRNDRRELSNCKIIEPRFLGFSGGQMSLHICEYN